MCGIAGFSFKDGKVSEGRRAVLANTLGRLNDNRGGDSWGIVTLDDDIRIKRGLGHIANHAYEMAGSNNLFLHTRYATHGAKTVANAHPFEMGHIVGAHNGVIFNHYMLCKEYGREFEVDSMHIFRHLADDLSFSEIEGYGAIEWVDRNNPNNIYLTKLNGGSLSICGIGDDKQHTDGIVWSSDERHLLEALQSAGLKNCFQYNVNEAQVYMVSNGEIFIVQRKLELSSKPRITYGVGHGVGHWNNYGSARRHKRGASSSVCIKDSDWQKDGEAKEDLDSPPSFARGDDSDKDLTEWQAWNEFCEQHTAEEQENNNKVYTC